MDLIGSSSIAHTAYEPTLWAKLFHSVPHVNITFHPVDSRFNPQNDLYLESIGILATIPAAWLITTLVILLIYLCTRCCDTKNVKKRKSRPIRCCLSFFALITVTALAVGFLGNHIFHTGMEDFQKSTMNINRIIQRSQEMARKYNDVFQKEIEENLRKLCDGVFQAELRDDRKAQFDLQDACDIARHNISGGLEAMDHIRFDIFEPKQRLAFQNIPYQMQIFEKYRWPTTMALQALFALFCLLIFVGAIVHSRCVLIIFSVCGLFSVILLWLLASVYTGVAVSLADFCYNPTPYVQHALSDQIKAEITVYYLQCAHGRTNPFESYISKSERAITSIDHKVRSIGQISRNKYDILVLNPHLDNLERASESTVQLMNDLKMSLRCEPIFRSYNTALVAACDNGLFGLILMLISAAFSGVLFTVLVWCNSHTWIYFKHKGRYIKVDDTDPYMPLSTIERPRMTATPSTMTPSNAATLRDTSAMPTTSATQLPGTSATLGWEQRRLGSISSQQNTPAYSTNGHHGMGTAPRMGYGGAGASSGVGSGVYGGIGGYSAGGPGVYGTTARSSHGGGAKLGTMGRQNSQVSNHGGYQGLDNLPATMTLGRRGHYASLRGGAAAGNGASGNHRGVSGMGGEDVAMLGPNQGQYATLSKQCRTLESSDFY